MASNFIQPGDTMDFTAPAGGVVSGNAYLIGNLLVVALVDAAVGVSFAGRTNGVWTLPKDGTALAGEGSLAYWDTATSSITNAPSLTAYRVGTAAAAAAAGDATCKVRLSGTPSVVNVA